MAVSSIGNIAGNNAIRLREERVKQKANTIGATLCLAPACLAPVALMAAGLA
jgi:hypothetical protein